MTIASVIVPDHLHLESLDDSALLSLQAEVAESRRQLDALSARLSAEVGRRSAPELGYAGLAQRSGSRTPEALVQRVAGVTLGEARALIRVGTALDGSSPWLAPVAAAVSAGGLSIAAADGIVLGLGEPGESVSEADLADAAARLVMVAGQTTPERVAGAARSIRDDLDLEGVADREAVLREKRFLRLIPQRDGMTKILGLLDPESAAVVVAAVDSLTAPRRGGPRFIDAEAVARSERIANDPRTTDQLAADALVDMVKLATEADKGLAVRGDRAHSSTACDTRRVASRGRFGAVRGPVGAGLTRDSRAAGLWHRVRSGAVRRIPAAGCRSLGAPVHLAPAGGARGARWWLPVSRMRSAARVVRSPPHRLLGS